MHFLQPKFGQQINLNNNASIPGLDLHKFIYNLKIDKHSLNSTPIQQSLILKEKYSFFNNVLYKKTILRRFYKIEMTRLYQRYTRLEDSLSYKFFQFSTSYLFNSSQNSKSINFLNKNDLSIKRVRFKPGYQTLWRRARENLKELLYKKFFYQKKLTKFLIRFYRTSHTQVHSKSLVSFEDCLLFSKLLPDPATITFFAKKNFLYLNNTQVSDTKSLVFIGDFLQMVISSWLLVYRQYMLSYHSAKFRKLKNLYRFKLSSHVVDTNKSFRTRSTTMPTAFLKYINLSSSIPCFIEVDFFSMSVFVIYNKKLNQQNLIQNRFTHQITIFKNYNWKYLV